MSVATSATRRFSGCRFIHLNHLLLFLIVAPALGLGATGLLAFQGDLARRPLEHADYDVWNSISQSGISPDGKWVMFNTQSGAIDGESTLTIRDTGSGGEFVVERSSGAQFSYDSQFAVYLITPDQKKVKELKKAEPKPNQMPKAKLQILELASGDITTIDRVESFELPEENGDWVACLLEELSESDKIDRKKADGRESYEVTPNGLRRPEKKLKLKKREELNPEAGESKEESTEESKENEEKQEAEQKSEKAKSASEGEKKTESDDKEKDDEEKKEKESGTPLFLIHLDSGVQRVFPNVVSYEFSKNGATFAFVTSVGRDEDQSATKNEDKDKDKEKDDAKDKEAEKTSGDGEESADGVHVIKLDSLDQTQVAGGMGEYKNLAFNEDGTQLAFVTNKDDYETKTSSWTLYHWTTNARTATAIATEGDKGIPSGWWIAPGSTQRFAEDGRRLYFDTAPVPDEVTKEREDAEAGRNDEKEDDEKEDDEDKVKLDIWHWQDPQLQPQQLVQAEIERNRDYRAAYGLKSKKIVQIATREIPDVAIDYRSASDITVANTNMPYRKMMSWDLPGFQDTWLVNVDTGEREKVLERVKWTASISPEGKFITWFDGEQRKWFAKSTDKAEGDSVEISKGIGFALENELHDTPTLPRPYGSAGWLTDDSGFLIYDRFDIWRVDPSGDGDPVCITGGFGRENEIRFRYQRLDPKERAIDPDTALVLDAFDEMTKASGYYLLDLAAATGDSDDAEDEPTENEGPLRQLIMLDENLSGLRKAAETDDVLFARSTFRMCPNLWASDLKFEKIDRVSDINPQQDETRWGSAELVHWTATDGQELDGILYKPDGFDPEEKYPMLVYFYERNSDKLHSYFAPAAGRSIINHSFYVSRGYLVFVPDIPYKVGEPGPSAANAILPGVESLIQEGFVDEQRIGMQGHSWGGYQVAYLVTQTDMFACAESGAPVSNMTSAYGGIRWRSGMSRMFQYERTQSRIGEDLWSARDKYLANSPLFYADKVNTPLLILHNDEDGAVPWYQGIELFVALRRLGKPSWMLNYNGNPHWVMGDRNRRDFAIRMQQFFDHYLMDAPEPEWMAVGVPAVDKGRKFGLELLEPEPMPESELKEDH